MTMESIRNDLATDFTDAHLRSASWRKPPCRCHSVFEVIVSPFARWGSSPTWVSFDVLIAHPFHSPVHHRLH